MDQVNIMTLSKMKQRGEKIAVLTCYDASFTRILEKAGMDVLLIGDSLGNVIQGYNTTIPVIVDDMVYHSECVSRVRSRALLVTDMPFLSSISKNIAFKTASRLMKEGGAHMVKLEGAGPHIDIVKILSNYGIPVCAHLGLLPQSVFRLGGYYVRGRQEQEAQTIIKDAIMLENAGAQMLVLECIPCSLGAEISKTVKIPVIGIGAGPHTDGQVLVLHDILGISVGKQPRFVKNFLVSKRSIQDAVIAYVQEVRDGTFPAEEHCFL